MERALESSAPAAQQSDCDGNSPDLLTQIEVCRRLGICDQTWMNWRKAGRVPEPVTMPSGRRKWRVVDIDRMAGVQQVPASRYFQSATRHARTLRVVETPVKGHAR